MPGMYRHDLVSMMKEIDEAVSYGVKAFVLFPHIADKLKDNTGTEAYNPNGLVPRAVAMIKSKHPDVIVMTDIALDPYSSMVWMYLLISLLYARAMMVLFRTVKLLMMRQ